MGLKPKPHTDSTVRAQPLERFDWAAWAQTEVARRLRDQPGALASASEHQLAQLLTVAIRHRFVEGAQRFWWFGKVILCLHTAGLLGSCHKTARGTWRRAARLRACKCLGVSK
ncbi:DUF6508 domain-containing protein [Sphingomonas sp.]|uniref:DUF6508 domain-containing protein n=1 Tax=Sphingomonas sp. TaxID=28214 RepID=UPI003AFF710E